MTLEQKHTNLSQWQNSRCKPTTLQTTTLTCFFVFDGSWQIATNMNFKMEWVLKNERVDFVVRKRKDRKMPAKSIEQVSTCLSGKKGWNCQELVNNTPVSLSCLPYKQGEQVRKGQCKPLKNGKHDWSKVQTGPRGGKFLYVDGIKFYLKKTQAAKLAKQFGEVQPTTSNSKQTSRVIRRTRTVKRT